MGAKYLALSQAPDAERWRLPDIARIEEVKATIEQAMTDGRAVRIPVVVGEATGELIVNGRAIEAAFVWEVGAHTEPTFSIID